MGLFDIFKKQPPLPTGLPDALMEAAYRQDSKALASLCAQHRDEIRRSFPVWRTVPAAVRRDAAAQDRYCKGLIAIASQFESSSDSSLIQLLMGDDADNPIVQWQRDLTEAQSLMDSGRAPEAVTLLHAVLERTRGLSGDGVAANKPRTLGNLGAAYFQAGDKARAIEFTQQALEICREVGDEEGVRIYSGNIQYIRNAAARSMGDDHVYSVNEVVSALGELHGRTVLISCVLHLEFEGNQISHRPKSECLPGYGSSLWADFDREALARNVIDPGRFQARHVVVRATVDRDDTGHMGLWPGAVIIRSIAKAKGGQPA